MRPWVSILLGRGPIPLGMAVRRAPRLAAKKVSRRMLQAALHARSLARPTYGGKPRRLGPALLSLPDAALEPHREWVGALCGRYLRHEFNLLGSGWLCQPGVPERINASNARPAARIRAVLRRVAPEYRPIDWHAAFSSGHRWPANRWNAGCRALTPPGVDIKEPWERARMQHLPVLAYGYRLLEEAEQRALCLREFQGQILDFLSANPPGFGVNWTCPMDVAIRAANWLVGYDLFRTAGAGPDPAFEGILAQAVHDHARFVFRFREASPVENNNHYLSNLCGLLFVAAYLEPSRETRRWVRHALPEFEREVRAQFHGDGSNFEGSVSYHRLSAEMAAYTTALILRMRARGAPDWTAALRDEEVASLAGRLPGMAEFSQEATNPSGRVWQIGDNDNGRFFKFQPVFFGRREIPEVFDRDRPALDFEVENPLDHRHLVAAINGLFERPEFLVFHGGNALDYALVRSLLSGARPPPARVSGGAPVPEDPGRPLPGGDELSGWNRTTIPLPRPIAPAGLRIRAFPDFGLYCYRADGFHLAVRCGGRGRCRKAGHMHEDQLSLCLWAGGKERIRDPGTAVYTPFPERRNAYRALSAHYAPLGREPYGSDYARRPVFAPPLHPARQCLRFTRDAFLGGTPGGGPEMFLRIRESSIELYSRFGAYPPPDRPPAVPHSPGYGLW